MLTLAGLERIRYVIVYPESGDVVLAGPAANWYVAADGRILSDTTHQAVMRLDDLLVLWRREQESPESYFGCSITPRQAALARTQEFLDRSSRHPLEPGRRREWLAQLRDTVGRQDIEIFGIDPTSRAAMVLVEADYHMKLIGMGLVDGVPGIVSYLDSIPPKQAPESMEILRWWFALHYDAIHKLEHGHVYRLEGQGARVLSENELLTERGERIHTGRANTLTAQFAASFTDHFVALCAKYPLYSELRNLFDLAVVSALIESHGLTKLANWKPTLFASAGGLALPRTRVPREVETVVNHRVMGRRQIVAGVSGGVLVETGSVLGSLGTMDSPTGRPRPTAPPDLAEDAWWWE
jgi:hypothetical protein